MTLSMLPTEVLVFLFLDLALMVIGGFMALGLPVNPREGAVSWGNGRSIVGVLLLARGLYRLLFLPSRISSFLEIEEVRGQLMIGFVTGVVSTIVIALLGYVLAYRAITDKMGDGGARNGLVGFGEALYKIRGLLGVLALIGAVLTIAPYLPSSGPVRRRRRLF